MKILLYISIFLLSSLSADVLDKKGHYFLSWGYNVSSYSTSDIRLQGDNYDYTLSDVIAEDRPTDMSITYLIEPTIPQWNFKLEYFIDNRQSISFNSDHMKYVVNRPQIAKINGLDHQGNAHANDMVELDDFLHFEHTDGLNYWNIGYNFFYPFWVNTKKEHALSIFSGVAAGVMIPRTNVTLVGHSDRKDAFIIAGYGVNIQAGLNFDFFEKYFIRYELKKGYIDMPWVTTSPNSSDKADHSFTFLEHALTAGYKF